ncbi:MAG TPA: ABC transporter permease, partial [Roseiarcus sp.]|nr:ABC transporter permease [Roseiarcus sp.]
MTAAALDAPAAQESPPLTTRPFARFEWMVAFRYLRARRKHGSISVIAGFSFLGIVLGVAALIVVMSVMNGFRHDLLDKIIGLNGHLFLQPAETPLTDYDAVTQRVKKVQGVKLVLPLVEGQALASSQFNSSGVLVRGVREADLKQLPGIAGHINLGTLNGFDSAGGAAIGVRLAEHLGLRIGDKITIIAPRGAQTPFGVTPRIKSYPVVAIFQIGMFQFDNTFVFLPLPEAQAFFNLDGQVNVIEAFVDDPDRMDEMRQRIEPALQRPMIMIDWRQRDQTFFEALNVERNVMFAILT